jgi:uncharacterized protein YggE
MELRTLVLLPAMVVGLAACGSGAPTYVTAQGVPPPRTITVSGTARVELTPDEACIELTLAARDPSMPAAHTQLDAGLTALLADLGTDRTLRVERGAIRYSPDYQSDAMGRSRLVGHLASAQVNVRTRDFAKIPEVVGRAAARGLDRVDVVYYATNLVERKAEVRRLALEAARDKARTMAETLGVALGDVETIEEGDSRTNARIEVANYAVSATTDATPDAPAAPGSIPLTVSVGVVYRLE